MTIAEQVKARCDGATAFTLYGGYATKPDGSRVMFPPGRPVAERRNDAGRVTYAEYAYDDKSRVVLTWHGERGARVVAKNA